MSDFPSSKFIYLILWLNDSLFHLESADAINIMIIISYGEVRNPYKMLAIDAI